MRDCLAKNGVCPQRQSMEVVELGIVSSPHHPPYARNGRSDGVSVWTFDSSIVMLSLLIMGLVSAA